MDQTRPEERQPQFEVSLSPVDRQSSCAFEWVLHGFTQSDRETDLLIVRAPEVFSRPS